MLKKLFLSAYEHLARDGYFQEHFGYSCVDGDVPGKLGEKIQDVLLFKLRKDDVWPIFNHIDAYKEDDLFDMIEFLYDHVSAPNPAGAFPHTFCDCGWHYKTFDKVPGQNLYVMKINEILGQYQSGFEISGDGEIMSLAPSGMEQLLSTSLETVDNENVLQRVEHAKNKFRSYHSTSDERSESVRELADVLEFLRSEAKKVLDSKDENELFQIVNNFGIRHHNGKQKTNYDKAIWHDWMFYYFLATIHACLSMIAKKNLKSL